MAASKWLDPNTASDPWTIADWTDTDLIVLMSHIWPSLKAAADERVAFSNRTQSSGFSEFDIFPDFTDGVLVNTDSASIEHDVTNIPRAVWSDQVNGSGQDGVVKTDEIETSGAYNASTSRPDLLILLSEFLQDVEGYASGTLQIITDTDNTARDHAVLKWLWAIQIYQAISYPTYYYRSLTTTGTSPFTNIEYFYRNVIVRYGSSHTAIPTHTCTTVTGLGTNTDIYTANDLNETFPVSTTQEVKDYIVSQRAGLPARVDADWVAVSTASVNRETAIASLDYDYIFTSGSPNNAVSNVVVAQDMAIRFKVSQDFRADNTKFDSDYYHNSYNSALNGIFKDFGTGDTELEIELNKLKPDGNGWYTLEFTGLDFSNTGTGAPPVDGTTETIDVGYKKALILPVGATGLQGMLVRPNLTDGTGYEYYTA